MPTLKLTNGAAHLLRNILNVPDALSTLKEKFSAGCLLTTTLDVLPEQPTEGVKEWLTEKWQDVDISNAQLEACKTAVNKMVDKIPAGAPLNTLITELGLTPD
jgi:hypothetical protein